MSAEQAIKELQKVMLCGEPYDFAAELAIQTIMDLEQENAKLRWLEAQFEAIEREKSGRNVSRGT